MVCTCTALLAANLVRRFNAKVAMLMQGRQRANASEVLEVISLGAEKGTELVLEATGEDAEIVIDALARLFADKFHEDDN